MNIFELEFPVTIVAKDGWATRWKESADNRIWNIHAIRKYKKIGFIAVDGKAKVWRLLDIRAGRAVHFWEQAISYFWSCRVPVQITVTEVEGDPLKIFSEEFLQALARDDDLLTQFHTKEQIVDVLKSAVSLPEAISTLSKMRVIRQ
jgi:hypothetical protein